MPNALQVRQMQPAPRNSFQGQEASLRSGTASAMKNEAMQAFNMGAPPKDRSNRRKIQPDWSNMKEVAYVNSQQEAELMNSLAKNVDEHHTENTQRSSLEEEVAKLQERHNKLHGRVKSTSEQVSKDSCRLLQVIIGGIFQAQLLGCIWQMCSHWPQCNHT